MTERIVLIAAGGTGGHIRPALMIGDELIRQSRGQVMPVYVCGNRQIELQMYQAAGIEPVILKVGSVSSGLGKLKYLGELSAALASATRLFGKFKPAALIATGGAVCAPMIYAARMRRIPFYLHESNAIPGRVTRHFARSAEITFLGFPLGSFENEEVVGTPVGMPLSLDSDDAERNVILCFGGSQGAQRLNKVFVEAMNKYRDSLKAFHPVLISGPGKEIENPGIVEVREFEAEMASLYRRCVLVISRSGAGSLAEIAAWGLPSILVPYPFAKDAHQDANAECFASSGGAIVLKEESLSAENLSQKIIDVVHHKEVLSAMREGALRLARPDAAEKIADRILKKVTGLSESKRSRVILPEGGL